MVTVEPNTAWFQQVMSLKLNFQLKLLDKNQTHMANKTTNQVELMECD